MNYNLVETFILGFHELQLHTSVSWTTIACYSFMNYKLHAITRVEKLWHGNMDLWALYKLWDEKRDLYKLWDGKEKQTYGFMNYNLIETFILRFHELQLHALTRFEKLWDGNMDLWALYKLWDGKEKHTYGFMNYNVVETFILGFHELQLHTRVAKLWDGSRVLWPLYKLCDGTKMVWYVVC